MRPKPAPTTFTRQQRLLLAVLPPLATAVLTALCLTLRIETLRDLGARPADTNSDPDLYAFFHRTLLLAAWQYRHRDIHILISASFDGELIARIVARMGFVPIRGSSSRGGLDGLLQLTAALRAGHKIALTVDGPRGPANLAKPGAVLIAQRTAPPQNRTTQLEEIPQATPDAQDHRNAPNRRHSPPTNLPTRETTRQPGSISAFHLHPHRAWTLRSWDRFLIPKPFTRVRAAWSTPIHVSRNEPIPEANARLQSALDRAVALATSNTL